MQSFLIKGGKHMKKTLLIAISTLAISLVGSSITSCSTTSSKLTIVHFDQTILGDAQKDLSVSIGIKKGNTELQTKINEALASISSSLALLLGVYLIPCFP